MFVPVTLPVLAVALATSLASGAFVCGRSISGMHDRVVHGQSLTLRSSEARTHWFGVLSFIFDSAAATTSVVKATAIVARSKRALGVVAQLGNAVKISGQTVKAIRMANFVSTIVKRINDNDVLSRVDLLYLVDAIYFFSNVHLSLEEVSCLVVLTNDVEKEFDIFDRNLTKTEMQQIGIIMQILGHYEPVGCFNEEESTDL